MKKVLALLLISAFFLQAPAFGYYHQRGRYYRDDSNDGNPYNNANYLGLNNGKKEVVCDNAGRCYSR